MKKIVLAFCLCAFLVAGMCACGNDDVANTTGVETTVETVETVEATDLVEGTVQETVPVADVTDAVAVPTETTGEPTPVEVEK